MGMMKMNLYIENKTRSILYFYHGGTVEEAGNNRDKIVSGVIGRIICRTEINRLRLETKKVP